MALARRGRGRGAGHSNIWPGFVDAVTTLLMVLMFVLTIFTVVQSVLRDRISSQDHQLDELSSQVSDLADALGLERGRVAELQAGLAAASDKADQQASLIATLTGQLQSQTAALDAAQGRITDFEAQVAALLTQRDAARGEVATLTEARDKLASDRDALDLALAQARSEIDAQTEAARLAAARREALEALVADLRKEGEATRAELAETQDSLSAAEAAKLADSAAAQALRDRLKNAEDELTSMTLALEAQRKKAEDTLTLLAAAEAARKDLAARLAEAVAARQGGEDLAGRAADLQQQLAAALAAKLAAEQESGRQMTEAERQATLFAAARSRLSEEEATSAEAARKVTLLNEQVAALRSQLAALQGMLDAASARDADAQVQIETLGGQLNSALAQAAAEQKRRAELEEAERKRLEEETRQLSRYRSEFFGRLSQLLEGRDGVRVVGDRFVFSSEVLFTPGSADLSEEGRSQIAGVVRILDQVAGEIPSQIDWIVRVDGHTDNVPLSGTGQYRDNWELSQARALSVVRYMIDGLGFPPNRLAATGFGEYRPVAEGDSPAARAQNRRIELKLTER